MNEFGCSPSVPLSTQLNTSRFARRSPHRSPRSQLVAHEQTNAILQAMHMIARLQTDVNLRDICDRLEATFEKTNGMQSLADVSFDGTLAQVRR